MSDFTHANAGEEFETASPIAELTRFKTHPFTRLSPYGDPNWATMMEEHLIRPVIVN
jgi:hypothetical protein